MVAGIKIDLETFTSRLRKRFADKLYSLPAPPSDLMSMDEANSYMTANGLCINKIEFENVCLHYSSGDSVDMMAFLSALMTDTSGENPNYHSMYGPSSPNEAHLALSGCSHVGFEAQYKPFPKHWGVPPNAQMKGHDGIMRDLPDGYGRGNAPMAKWVAANMEKDTKSETTTRGCKPLPFGNYSL